MPNKDSTKRKEWTEAYNRAMSVWASWFQEAKTDLQFRLGDSWSWEDKVYMKTQQRDPLVFNRIRRVVKLLTGYQRTNRLALNIKPEEGSDDKTASQFSGLIQHIMNREMGYETISDAFENGPVTCGLNLVEPYLDYSLDPVNGDFGFNRVAHNEALLDPYFKKRNLSDCQYILRRKWLAKGQAKAAFPDQDKEIDKIHPQGRDGKFPDSPPSTNFGGENLYRLDEFHVRTTKPAKLLVDTETGEFVIFRGSKKRLDQFLRTPDPETGFNLGDRVTVHPHYYNTVELTLFLDDVVMYEGADLLGIDDFNFVPLIGEWVPEYPEMKDKLQGVVRCIRDPLTESNRRRLKILDIIDSVISTGFKAEEGSVINPKSLYQTGQQKVVWVKAGMMEKVQEFSGSGQVPQGLFQIMEQLDQDIMDIPGVAGLLQAPEEQNQQIAASLAKLREGQGLVPQQDLFDNLRLAKKLLGKMLVRAIQINWTPAKVKRLLNEEVSPQFFDRDFSRYDCIPTEGQLTDTQRQACYVQLMEAKQLGAPVSWKLIMKYSPMEVKEEIIREIEAGEQAQAQAAQAELMSQQVTEKLLNAEAFLRIAQGQEKIAEISADRAKAGYDIARTMAEIRKMDSERLASLLQIALDIERQGGMGFKALPAPAPATSKQKQSMTRR